ncbi:MAG TPA: hypothetical protein PLN85_01380 [archaeon]|nr:hypothetical protein [archaeon]
MKLRKFIETTIREYLNEHVENTDNDLKILFDIAKELSEKMYCDVYGSCVHFAELFVEKVEEVNAKLLGDIKVIEGYVYTNDGKFQHTWIELKNGEKIDPTFKQFIGTVNKITKKKSYTGYEYLNDSTNTWFKERRKQYPHYVFK